MIAGGLGDLGRCLVRWMVERGGKNFILLSRSGLHTDVAKDMVRKLDEKGVNVFAPLCDIADARSLGKALEQATKTMPPIKGCIQASAALRVRYLFTEQAVNDTDSNLLGCHVREHGFQSLERCH